MSTQKVNNKDFLAMFSQQVAAFNNATLPSRGDCIDGAGRIIINNLTLSIRSTDGHFTTLIKLQNPELQLWFKNDILEFWIMNFPGADYWRLFIGRTDITQANQWDFHIRKIGDLEIGLGFHP